MAKKEINTTDSATQAVSNINSNFGELYDAVAPAESGGYGSSKFVGEPISSVSTPARMVVDMNTVRMISDLRKNQINVSEHYGHEPQMVIHGGKAYIVYRYHEKGGGEDNSSTLGDEGRPKVRMTIVTLGDAPTVEYKMVCTKGDTYTLNGDTVTVVDATAPNLVLLDTNNDNTIDTLRIVFSSDPNRMLLYRDYNISTGTFGNIGVCGIKKDSPYFIPASLANFKSEIENAGGTIQVHGQYAFIEDKYYIAIGNGISGKNGNIFTTQDFINFTWFAKPSIPAISENLGFMSEMAIYPWINSATSECCLYLAIRRGESATDLIVARMHIGRGYYQNRFFDSTPDAEHPNRHTPGEIAGYKLVPCRSSRPCFIAPAAKNDFLQTKGFENIYLVYDNVSQDYPIRSYTDVCFFKTNSMTDGNTRKVAQCLRLTYPAIVYNGGEYYVAYQGSGVDSQNNSQPHIYLSKFSPFSATFDKVVSVYNKLFDMFEPE